MANATIIHYIADMDRALSFYKGAMNFGSTSESPYWSSLRVSDGFELGLHPALKKSADDSGNVHPFDAGETSLSLDVDDLDSCIDRIKVQGGSLERIFTPDHDPARRIALVYDPDGNGFQVCGK
jgi:predicted enzyme related to lactoylglutathione lyase